jgi:hypothetical protein
MRLVSAMKYRILILTALLLAWPCSENGFKAAPIEDYKVKAAFLVNFIHFTNWPGNPTDQQPIHIGVVGEDPFNGELGRIAAASKTRSLSVVNVAHVEDCEKCQVVYLSTRDKSEALREMTRLADRGILVVGDHPDLARWGASIAFAPVDGRMRFIINLRAVKAQGLQLNSQMLKLAIDLIK